MSPVPLALAREYLRLSLRVAHVIATSVFSVSPYRSRHIELVNANVNGGIRKYRYLNNIDVFVTCRKSRFWLKSSGTASKHYG